MVRREGGLKRRWRRWNMALRVRPEVLEEIESREGQEMSESI